MKRYMPFFKEGISSEEEIEMYLDIISMNPDNPSYDKYKAVLKDKFNIDWKKMLNDDFYIENVNLDDIKNVKDFRNWDKYVKYAKEIFHLKGVGRGQSEIKEIDGEIDLNKATEIGEILNFKIQYKPNYSPMDTIATASKSFINMPKSLDINTFIHELGHVYDNKYYKEGISKDIVYASTPYGLRTGGECFAENFKLYFIAPSFLKKYLPEVYSDLNKRINSKWKNVIRGMIA